LSREAVRRKISLLIIVAYLCNALHAAKHINLTSEWPPKDHRLCVIFAII